MPRNSENNFTRNAGVLSYLCRPVKYWFYLFISAILIFSSCQKETEELNALGKEYFGYELGQTRYYQCDSTLYNSFNPQNPVVKREFIIRERVKSKFIDNEGNEVFRLERYISFDKDTSYSFFGLATIQIDELGIQYYENNTRYVRMSFPIRKKRSWDGNIFNNSERQRYVYIGVNEPYSNGFMNFDEVVSVNQRDELTIISEKVDNYWYGKGVGLIEKAIQNIDINGSDKDGFELSWKLESMQ